MGRVASSHSNEQPQAAIERRIGRVKCCHEGVCAKKSRTSNVHGTVRAKSQSASKTKAKIKEGRIESPAAPPRRPQPGRHWAAASAPRLPIGRSAQLASLHQSPTSHPLQARTCVSWRNDCLGGPLGHRELSAALPALGPLQPNGRACQAHFSLTCRVGDLGWPQWVTVYIFPNRRTRAEAWIPIL
jgi:hypothetical protein